MRNISVLSMACAIALISTTAFAKPQIFKGEGIYTKAGWESRFNELEAMGVQIAAQQHGLGACAAAGATDCVILGSQIEKCNLSYDLYSIGCWAVAQIRGNVE